MAALNSQRQKMKMQQKLTPQQLLLMRLLQLPVTTLEQRIKEEVEKNPMLEVNEMEPQDQYDSTDRVDPNDEDGDFRGANGTAVVPKNGFQCEKAITLTDWRVLTYSIAEKTCRKREV